MQISVRTDVQDIPVPIIAAVVAGLVAFGSAFLNHRLGLDAATERYIESLEGLVKARDAEIADLRLRIDDLERDNRSMERRLKNLEAGFDA